MKYTDEYRVKEPAERYSKLIHKITTKPWNIMEVCGGQTHTFLVYSREGGNP